MLRYVRLSHPEPYRAAGTNTLRVPVVIQTLKPRPKSVRLTRRIAVNG